MAVLLAWSGTVAASPVPLTPRLPPHVGLGGTPAAGQEAQVVPEPGVGFGRAASARMWGRKRARHVSYVTGFTGLDPRPAAGTGGRKRCSFPRSPGGQADGCTHTRIHPSLSHPVIPARFQRSIWEPLCSCWHKPKWLLWGRIPPVLKISLRSSSLSAGNSLHSWRISFVFLCFPFPFRAEGSGTAFSQAATGLHPRRAAPLSFQPGTYTLRPSGRVQMGLDRSAVSPQTDASFAVSCT